MLPAGRDTIPGEAGDTTTGWPTSWPLCVFYGMVNTGVRNSWIIYKVNVMKRGDNQRRGGSVCRLIKPWTEQRLPSSTLSIQLINLIFIMSDIPTPGTPTGEAGPVAAESGYPLLRCVDCTTGSNRKAGHRCHVCCHPVCPRYCHPACTGCEVNISVLGLGAINVVVVVVNKVSLPHNK